MVAIEQVSRGRTAPTAPAAPGSDAEAKGGRLAWPVKFYLLAVMLPFGFSLGSIYLTGVRLVLLVMIVPLFFQLLSGKFGKLVISDVCFVLYLGWAVLSYGLNHPADLVQHIGSTGVEFLGGYLLARAFIRTRAQFVSLCKALSFLAAITLPLALYESQTGRPILIDMIQRIPGIRSEGVITIERRLGMERVQGIFAHPIHYGLFCSVAFSLTYVALEGLIGNTRRLIMSAIIGLCTFFALSAGAFLALLLQIFMIVWFTVFRDHARKWTYLLILFILTYIAIDLLSTRTPVRVFMSYATFNAHTAYWRGIIFEWGMMNIFGNAANNIPASPWIGIGDNDWVRPHFVNSPSVDNFWLLTTMRYGVPAFLLLVLGYATTIWRIGRRDFRGDARLEKLRRAWVFTFCGLTFTLITVHVWTTIYSFVFFMFGAGIWMLSASPGSAGQEEDAGAPADAPGAERTRYSRFPVKPRGAETSAAAPRSPAHTRPGRRPA